MSPPSFVSRPWLERLRLFLALPPVDRGEVPEIPCVRCGYNLRGLDAQGACPECGAPKGPSLHRERLVFSDGIWLRTLRLGTLLIGADILLACVGAGLHALLHIATAYWALANWLIVLIHTVGFGLGALGVAAVLVREPVNGGPRLRYRPADLALIVAAGIHGFMVLVAMVGEGTRLLPLGVIEATRTPAWRLAQHGLFLLLASAVAWRLASLARRIPSRSLALHAWLVAGFTVACVGLALVLGGSNFSDWGSAPPPQAARVLWIGTAAWLASLVAQAALLARFHSVCNIVLRSNQR